MVYNVVCLDCKNVYIGHTGMNGVYGRRLRVRKEFFKTKLPEGKSIK